MAGALEGFPGEGGSVRDQGSNRPAALSVETLLGERRYPCSARARCG